MDKNIQYVSVFMCFSVSSVCSMVQTIIGLARVWGRVGKFLRINFVKINFKVIEKIKNIRAEQKEELNERRIAEKVGQTGLNDFARYLHSPLRIIWSNLLAGIFRGLGFVIGATAVLAIAVYILVQILGNLPWVGEYFAQIGEFVDSIQEGAETLKSIGR